MAYISVIVPVYNAEKSIERCVNSICGQTFTNLEIILVDDGSQDRSGELCDTLAQKDSRITVLHKKNGGVSAARNIGIELAKGQYIQFVDSDDYIPENYCEQLVDAQKRFGEDAFIWTGVRIVSENSAVAEQNIRYSDSECDVLQRRDVLKLSAQSLLNSPCNKLYHRDIISEHGLRMDTAISLAEDLKFNLAYLSKMQNQDSIVIVNQINYNYMRNGEASLDNRYYAGYYEVHKPILNSIRDYSIEWGAPKEDEPLYYSRYWDYMQHALYNNNFEKSPLTDKEKVRENNKILRDKAFIKCLKEHKKEESRGRYLAMRTKNYRFVMMYERYISKRNRTQ